jgi:ribosomal protein L11 methyltransferase
MEQKSLIKMWNVVTITCSPEFEDVLGTLIFESGFSGFEEHNNPDSVNIKAYYPQSLSPDPTEILLKLIEKLFGKDTNRKFEISRVETIPDEDWETRWREGLTAVETGKSLVIRPSWVKYDNTGNRIEIIIDPKMAFGTGSHATTYLCLEALERLNPEGKTIIDAGCGSGVLSIAAAKMRAKRIFSFDNDPFSVDNALENAGINEVQDCVQIALLNLEQAKPEPSDLVLANLIYNVLVNNLHHFREFLNPEGKIIYSGLLAEQEIPFLEHLKREGFRVIDISYRDEWMAVTADMY